MECSVCGSPCNDHDGIVLDGQRVHLCDEHLEDTHEERFYVLTGAAA